MGDRPCQSQVKAKEGYPDSPWEHGVHLEGGRLPHSRVLRHPFPSRPSPRCTISCPPTPYLSRAYPSSQVLEFQMLSPLAVPRAPPPNLLLFIRAVEKDYFLGTHPSSSHCPHASVSCSCAILGGMGGAEGGSPTLNSQRQWADETLFPFPAPSSSLIKTCL